MDGRAYSLSGFPSVGVFAISTSVIVVALAIPFPVLEFRKQSAGLKS